jgi:hypothetical protein
MYKNTRKEIDPAVGLLEEIEDQDLTIHGGTDPVTLFLCPIGYAVGSVVLGNKGAICTATVECQNNCRH